jgi:hypothetical protein
MEKNYWTEKPGTKNLPKWNVERKINLKEKKKNTSKLWDHFKPKYM